MITLPKKIQKSAVPELNERLPIAETFTGINGEGLKSGAPALFFRFAGCNLRCGWCDTKWANEPDCPVIYRTAEECYLHALDKGLPNITLTGGEPLIQPNILPLIRKLADDSFFFTEIETNGAVSLEHIRRSGEHISFTVDCKLPSSGMSDRMLYKNFGFLGKRDAVKFVVGAESDLDEIIRIMDEFTLAKRTNIFISPVYGVIEPERIAQFLVENALEARLMLQLHKIIWGEDRRGV
jgi:7-carboxy-7-deazaguanine synthase